MLHYTWLSDAHTCTQGSRVAGGSSEGLGDRCPVATSDNRVPDLPEA